MYKMFYIMRFSELCNRFQRNSRKKDYQKLQIEGDLKYYNLLQPFLRLKMN